MSSVLKRLPFIVCGALVLCVLAVYARVADCSFLLYDDTTHVTENPLVVRGLNWESAWNAFAAPHVSLWIPVTWISFMADVSVFGLSARAMHIENVLFHAANALLLFTLLYRATRRIWPGAAVAALFAIHPINVESVAWITERKNVLCLFFGLLSLHAYTTYAQRASRSAYAASIILFGLAVLAKPMIVPLPAGLVLLDIWPYQRIDWKNWKRRALEKVPYLLITIGSSVMTMRASMNRSSAVTFDQLSLGARVSNALVSYATYLRQLVWPNDLGVLYPHPQVVEPLKAGVSAMVLLVITFAAWKLRRKYSYLLVGWLWFLGMLVPMIGLIQVGTQGHADRFVYAAEIGLFAAVIWLIADLWGSRPQRLLVYASAIVGAGLLMMTLRQVEYWTNGVTLFEHAISLVKRNPLAYANAGIARAQLGDYRSAVSHYQMSLSFAPKNPQILNHLGVALLQLGRNAEAVEAIREAVDQSPTFTAARINLANAYERTGDDAQAIGEYRKLVQADPGFAPAHYRLGTLLAKRGEVEAATVAFKEAARLRPNDPVIAEALRKTAKDTAR